MKKKKQEDAVLDGSRRALPNGRHTFRAVRRSSGGGSPTESDDRVCQ